MNRHLKLLIPVLLVLSLVSATARMKPKLAPDHGLHGITLGGLDLYEAQVPAPFVSTLLLPPERPEVVAAREAQMAAQRAMMDQWAVDGAQAKVDLEARLAAAAADAEAKRVPVAKQQTPTIPRAGSSGGAGMPSIQCESGGNYSENTGNGYYGAYQFDQQTWQAAGGSGLASQASPAEQDSRAAAWVASGHRSAWPNC